MSKTSNIEKAIKDTFASIDAKLKEEMFFEIEGENLLINESGTTASILYVDEDHK